jgi:hypothetical protein
VFIRIIRFPVLSEIRNGVVKRNAVVISETDIKGFYVDAQDAGRLPGRIVDYHRESFSADLEALVRDSAGRMWRCHMEVLTGEISIRPLANGVD